MGGLQDDSFNEETFDDGAGTEGTDSYPALAPRGHAAKDWDSCLLQDVSAKRIRLMAKSYQGIPGSMNKAEMFKATTRLGRETGQAKFKNGQLDG